MLIVDRMHGETTNKIRIYIGVSSSPWSFGLGFGIRVQVRDSGSGFGVRGSSSQLESGLGWKIGNRHADIFP